MAELSATALERFNALVRGPHEARVEASLLRHDGAGTGIDVPVAQLDWSNDGTQPLALSATLTVPATTRHGGAVCDWVPRSTRAHLSPFSGNLVDLALVVSAGSGSVRLRLGRMVIDSIEHDWPAQTLKVGLLDLARRPALCQLTKDRPARGDVVPASRGEDPVVGPRLEDWVEFLVERCGHRVRLVDVDGVFDGSPRVSAKKVQWNAGANVWDTARTITARRGGVLRFSRGGTLQAVARRRRLPVGTLTDGDRGTVVSAKWSIGLGEFANGFQARVEDTHVKRRAKPSDGAAADSSSAFLAKHTVGPLAWGGPLGTVARCEVSQVEDPDSGAAEQLAGKRLAQAFGATMGLELQVIGGFWLDPGDRVRVSLGGHADEWTVASVSGSVPGMVATVQMVQVVDATPEDHFALLGGPS